MHWEAGREGRYSGASRGIVALGPQGCRGHWDHQGELGTSGV